ncbi:MAG: CRTAC1 family protein [Planctomycetota bacterium]|nr:MAG: CRTAC1 family protein [Planctomycetota bacterium]
MNSNEDRDRSFEDSAPDVQNDEVIGRALQQSAIVLVAVAVVGGLGWLGWKWWSVEPVVEQRTEIALPQDRAIDPLRLPRIPLADVTQQAAVDWVHVSGKEGEKLLPETMGGGVAIFDFDRDGDQDLLFVGGTSWPWAKRPIESPRSLCLYANEGGWRFKDVTADANLPDRFYGMAPVVGDFDNDGWPDVFVTAVGANRLLRNSEGRFEDVTQAAGLADDQLWSTGATWVDYDRDGFLDLFVCNYVQWSRELDRSLGFQLTGVGRAYGQPTAFSGMQCQLFHNQHDGSFADVSSEMGIEQFNPNTGVPMGKALAAAAIDIDQDGWQDIIVANDTVQNFLFLNLQGKQFEESGVPMGVAFDRNGNATGAMGIDCGFFRNDAELGILIGNFANEPSSLYVSRQPLAPFNDEAISSGIGPQSRLNLTFGVFFCDLDLDGRLDVVAANGHLEEEISQVQASQAYEQPPQFFWNAGAAGTSEFIPLTAEQVGAEALRPMVGRGAAGGDLDQDGDIDIVLVANSGRPRLLRNDQQLGHHWLRVDLEGTMPSNRDALGAVVEVPLPDGQVQRQTVMSARSYLSQCEHPLTFGLGDAAGDVPVHVRWPSGRVERFVCQADRQHHLVEGTGEPVE